MERSDWSILCACNKYIYIRPWQSEEILCEHIYNAHGGKRVKIVTEL